MRKLLWLKMLRDIKRSASTYFICVLIVAVGFCGYSVLELCCENLQKSRDSFLEDSKFCDGFADVKQAPASKTRSLEEIDGIELAQARLAQTVRLEGYEEEAELKLVSWTADGMNQPMLSEGTYPRPGSREIIIGGGMAKARGIRPGDRVELAAGGKRVSMEVTGIGLSPENIYMIKDISDLFPDPAAYDAGFVPYDTMEGLFSMTGRANGFLLKLEQGKTWEDVKDEAERLLEPFGCREAYSRDDQLSINMVNTEIEQLARMSGAVPFLFLAVAGMILYITLSRLVEQQRTQAGTLMALGIPAGGIKLHYMCYGAFTGFAGGVLGGILGYAGAGPMAGFYRMYFSLPKVATPLSYTYFVGGAAAAAVFCAGISWMAARALGELAPAQALRPPAPKTARISMLERLPGFSSVLTVPGLMAVRGLARNRRRSAISLLGIASAYMITTALVSMNSLFDVFLFDYWEQTQRQDVTVQFSCPVKKSAALEAVRHPELTEAEGILEFPVTLYGPDGKTDSTVQAFSENSNLTRLFSADGKRIRVRQEGIVLSEHMASLLGVEAGDKIEVKSLYPKERVSRVKVTSVIAQYMGSAAYMSAEGAARITDYQDSCTAVLIKAPPGAIAEIKERLKDAGGVACVESRQERVKKYRSMMGSMSAMMASMSMLGVIIGAAVIYVSSLISFEELKRELSTLMMLGLKSGECLEVISTGQWILAAGGVVLGIPMAVGASRLLSVSMASDLYTIPDFVDGRSMVQAMALTALSVGFASVMMLKKLKKMSPAEMLKDRE